MKKQELEDYKKAGEIAIKIKEYARELIKPDMLLLEIAQKIEKKIESEYKLQGQYLNNTSKYQEGMEIKFKKVLRKK